MLDAERVGPSAPLESWWVPTSVLAGTAILVTLILVARRRGWLRRRTGALAVGVVGGLLGLLTGLNSYAGYLPTLRSLPAMVGYPGDTRVSGDTDLPRGSGSLVASIRLGSSALRVPTQTVYLYLPPGYRSGATLRYPVLYLYGGWPGRSTDWLAAGRLPEMMDALIAQHRIQPMIVVMPDTTLGGFRDTECLDAVGGPRLESFLTGPLVKYVDSHFRTVADRSGRALGGMSSGGFCALNLGLHHTGQVGAIAALEPYPSPGGGPESSALHNDRTLVRRNTVTEYLPTMRFAGRVPVFLDWPGRASGSERADNLRIAALLRQRGQPVVTTTEPTFHTWREAQYAEPAMLTFVGGHLGQPTRTPVSAAGSATRPGAPR
ncbi:alpha/beta hydrolase [Actinocatenispora rupis]|uniref:Esterase n=1 Tax=Actinocatenispora rupis TaxID=519421 RepID=A0A8J3NDS3_9ACTN|nr:alpha/beta hydrolase-fold protein [Actinocatenispora rupis]GID13252.1 esterase [Actinocatenispora rupis]